MYYSEDPDLRADGDPQAEEFRDRQPSVSDHAKKFILEAENVEEALFDLCSLFRIPVTNNTSWFEDGDINKPVYHVGEFVELVKDCFLHAGWTPPES